MPVIADHPAILKFVEDRVGTRFITPSRNMGSVMKDGTLGAGFVFHNYCNDNIEITLAVLPGGVTRSLLRASCRYVFDQLRCKGMVALVKGDNAASRSLAIRCGLKERAVIEDYFGDGDSMIVLRMKREECRWL